ncbi:MAG: leucine--tRNA ligase [Paludibacteraceae bacterium]|nr:leucine--tRNA ligase [Paludibacteraceae bacterium]MBN2786968.1 leucine--tRNA ligase [Paludibacteraceae bacterium]
MKFKISLPPAPSERGGECLPYQTADLYSYALLKELSEIHRKNTTEAESVLWSVLRNKSLSGYKFRRQHIIDKYIVDFVCLEKHLIVEVDGGYHNRPDIQEADKVRTFILREKDFEVIRFTNDEVINNIHVVLEKIEKKLNSIEIQPKLDQTISPSVGGGRGEASLTVFTTRADTIYGVTFMVLAPESEYTQLVTTAEQKSEVDKYLHKVKNRTERERLADRKVSGVFSGSYAINPISGTEIPIWISDYVLAGYGTGAIMAVPAHDSRDYAFAKHFNLPIICLIEGADISEESLDAKEGIMMNSGFLNGLNVKEAIQKAKDYIKENNLGRVKTNYRLRDAIFSRQRYWGEPFPVYYKDGMPQMLDEKELPLELPEVDKYLPTEKGEPPLGRAKNWQTKEGYPLELNTMPGFAGSSAYFLRYMDPKNNKELVSKEANNYWKSVDLYLGGIEHATGHLIYSRVWNKFLYDIGEICEDEPFKKLINQGMIQGRSNFVYRLVLPIEFKEKIYISKKYYDLLEKENISNIELQEFQKEARRQISKVNSELVERLEKLNSITWNKQGIHVDVNIVDNDVLNIEEFRNHPKYKQDAKDAIFILEDDKFICGWAVEKMSKSMDNVVNPDDIVEKYGADTLRLYEMFLGPLEQSKPWDTNGIDGVHRFLKRLWSLFYKGEEYIVTDEDPIADELKILHKTIKKIEWDIENFSFNTSVSAFMICVNELSSMKCSKKAILSDLVVLLAPYVPHIAEELWHVLGNKASVCDAKFPVFNEAYLVESVVKYPISFNGKVKFTLELPADMNKEEVEKTALANEQTIKQLNGNAPKKVIVVLGKIVNIVL